MLLRPLQFISFVPQFIEASPILVKRLYPDPEPCLGNCSWIHDPSIYVENGTYYRFSTSGNIAVATANSMKGPWTYQGALLGKETKIKIDEKRQDVWAPNVVKIDTTFYCYYSVSYLGAQNSQIGLATSPSLNLTSWIDHGTVDIPASPSYNLIDPAVFQEAPNAPIYITFGSYWSGIFSLRLSPSTLTYRHTAPLSPAQNLHWNGTRTSNSTVHTTQYSHSNLRNLVRNTTTDPDVVEGAFMYQHAGTYFLFFSAGACCATPPRLAPPGREYRILVCKAATPGGPFLDAKGRRCDEGGGTVVLGSHGDVYAPGGQGVLFDERVGRTVIYYHYGELEIVWEGGRG